MAPPVPPRPKTLRRPPVSLAAVPHRELALALRTQSLRAVARHYGVSRNTARYWRDQLGLTSPAVPGHPGRGLGLQPRILAYLTAHPEGATRATLATALHDTPLMLYRVLRRLEARGQVTRTLEQIPGRFESQSRWFVAPEPADRVFP
jgi:transposase-like protein